MSKYLCMECKHNNNGWCKVKSKNGLKKLNIQECKYYKNNDSTLLIQRTEKDYYGQQFISIKINNEIVDIPERIIEDFINDKKLQEISVNIPKDDYDEKR